MTVAGLLVACSWNSMSWLHIQLQSRSYGPPDLGMADFSPKTMWLTTWYQRMKKAVLVTVTGKEEEENQPGPEILFLTTRKLTVRAVAPPTWQTHLGSGYSFSRLYAILKSHARCEPLPAAYRATAFTKDLVQESLLQWVLCQPTTFYPTTLLRLYVFLNNLSLYLNPYNLEHPWLTSPTKLSTKWRTTLSLKVHCIGLYLSSFLLIGPPFPILLFLSW